MIRKIGVVLAVAACAVAATAGTARADVQAPASDWCGQAEGTCDASLVYMQCSDGTVWVFAPANFDADTYGAVFCGGDYSLLQPPPRPNQWGGRNDHGTVNLGLGADPWMAPDPSEYSGEVQCPDGSIWAVAPGDPFVCPAA